MDFIKKYFIIIYLLFLFLLVWLLNSCSPQWHVERAINKDPAILKVKVDTVRIKTIEYIDSVKGVGSMIVDNNEVYIKVKSINDSIDLIYKVKERVFDTLITNTVIEIQPKVTRQDKRLKARVEINKIKAEKQIKKKKIEKEILSIDKNKGFFRRFWFYLEHTLYAIFFFLIGFFVSKVLFNLKKR